MHTVQRSQDLLPLVQGVFEQSCFIFCDAVSVAEALDSVGETNVVVVTEFSGDVVGSLTVGVAYEACCEMAANMLGMECDSDRVRSHAERALCELGNVVCGNLLGHLFPDALCDIGQPVSSMVGASELQTLCNHPGSLPLLVEDSAGVVHLVIQP